MSWEGPKGKAKIERETMDGASAPAPTILHCLFQLEQVEQLRLTNSKTHNVAMR